MGIHCSKISAVYRRAVHRPPHRSPSARRPGPPHTSKDHHGPEGARSDAQAWHRRLSKPSPPVRLHRTRSREHVVHRHSEPCRTHSCSPRAHGCSLQHARLQPPSRTTAAPISLQHARQQPPARAAAGTAPQRRASARTLKLAEMAPALHHGSIPALRPSLQLSRAKALPRLLGRGLSRYTALIVAPQPGQGSPMTEGAARPARSQVHKSPSPAIPLTLLTGT